MSLQKKYFALLSITLFIVVVSGCATNSVPFNKFRNNVVDTSTIIGSYYKEINDFERKVYLDERLYDKNLEILLKDEQGDTTALFARFSEESIHARLDALTLRVCEIITFTTLS